MRMSRPMARKQARKPAGRPSKIVAARRVAKPSKKGVSSKATNWIHARARSVRHGHQPRTVALGIFSGLFSTILLGLWLSGYLGDTYGAGIRFAENRLLAVGFGVDHINVAGARRTSEAEVRKVLGVEKGELVFAIDLDAARARVESLGWVRQASVTRLLPNRISVVITERTPYAVWQSNQSFSIVNAAGARIEPTDTVSYAGLPLIVGKGAESEAAKLLSKFGTKRGLSGKVHSVIRVSERRWNVRFHSGSELYLPAANWQKTLDVVLADTDLVAILELPAILVDARISGEIAVRPMPAHALPKPKMVG